MQRTNRSGRVGELVVAVALMVTSGAALAGNFVRSEDQVYWEGRYSFNTATQYWGQDGTQTGIGCQDGTDAATATQYNDCKSQSQFASMIFEYGASYYYTLFAETGYGQSRYTPQGKPCVVGGPAGDPTTCPTTTSGQPQNLAPTATRTGMTDSIVGIRGRLDPYENFKTWELEAEVPTSATEPGQSRLGCGVWGGAFRMERKFELATRDPDVAAGLPYLALELGAAGYYWQKPLNPQVRAVFAFSGSVSENWGWFLGASGFGPVAKREQDPNVSAAAAAAADCGTSAKAVQGTLEIKHQIGSDVYFNCGGYGVAWGRDISKSAGGYCGLTSLWK